MKSFLLQTTAFFVILTGHFALSSLGFYNSIGKFGSLSIGKYLFLYVNSLKHFIGLSLGLIAFFTVYVVRKYLEVKDLRSIRAGVITALIILLGGYLFFGIHESTPQFHYFMGLMGYFYVKVQFIIFFMVTLISIITGMIIVWRQSKKLKKH